MHLARGKEGSTNLYYDRHTSKAVVIKDFSTKRHPLRNKIPRSLRKYLGKLPSHWPTEIPATSLFEGGTSSISPVHNSTLEPMGILPLHDYFATPVDSSTGKNCREQWHLVTSFLPHGTLAKFAQVVRSSPSNLSITELDATYRPAFQKLHRTVKQLHAHGFCHDDIKAPNISVQQAND